MRNILWCVYLGKEFYRQRNQQGQRPCLSQSRRRMIQSNLMFWRELQKVIILFFFPFIFISWRLITLQWHESAMDLHVFPILNPLPPPSPSHPSGSSQCTSPEHLAHASNLGWWSVSCFTLDSILVSAVLSEHPTLAFSPRVQKSVLYICVSFPVLRIGLSLPSF